MVKTRWDYGTKIGKVQYEFWSDQASDQAEGGSHRSSSLTGSPASET